jgi:hypothetical protein
VHAIYRDASGLLANRLSESRSSNGSNRQVGRTLKDYAGQPVRLMDRTTLRAYQGLLERELQIARAALATLEANEGSLAGRYDGGAAQPLSGLGATGGGGNSGNGDRDGSVNAPPRSNTPGGGVYRTNTGTALSYPSPAHGSRGRVAPTPTAAAASSIGSTAIGGAGMNPTPRASPGTQTRFVPPPSMQSRTSSAQAFVSTAKPPSNAAVTTNTTANKSLAGGQTRSVIVGANAPTRMSSPSSAPSNRGTTTGSGTISAPPSGPLSINTSSEQDGLLVGSALGQLIAGGPGSSNSSPTAASSIMNTPSVRAGTDSIANALQRLVVSVDDRQLSPRSTASINTTNNTESPVAHSSIALTTLTSSSSSAGVPFHHGSGNNSGIHGHHITAGNGGWSHGISSRASAAGVLRSHVSMSTPPSGGSPHSSDAPDQLPHSTPGTLAAATSSM